LNPGAPDGSFYFDNQPNMLDQFLVNQIMRLPAMVNLGVYPKPIPFGGMGKPANQNGFSDHFPITMTVTQVDYVTGGPVLTS
jgi:hypothetical protein